MNLKITPEQCAELSKGITQGEWDLGCEDNQCCEAQLPNDACISLSRYSRFTDDLVMGRNEMLANIHAVISLPEILVLVADQQKEIESLKTYIEDIKEAAAEDSWCQECGLENINNALKRIPSNQLAHIK